MSVTEDVRQKVEWRTRLVLDLVARKYDDETLFAMLEAGLDQAHSEGLLDAAEVCQRIAESVPAARRVASTLASSIRELERRNRRSVA